MNQEVRHNIFAAILSAVLGSMTLYFHFQPRHNSGRLLGFASLVVGWSLVALLVGTHRITPTEGLIQTMYLCAGATLGSALRLFTKRPEAPSIEGPQRPLSAP